MLVCAYLLFARRGRSFRNSSEIAGYAFGTAVQALEFSLSPHGMLKVDEVEPGTITTPAPDLVYRRDLLQKADNDYPHASVHRSMTLKEHLLTGLEMVSTWRGIGWAVGTGANVYIPPEYRDTTNTAKFLRQTCGSFIVNFLLADFHYSILQLIPNIGLPSGGSIFAFGSNALEKYIFSTGIHFSTGLVVLSSECSRPRIDCSLAHVFLVTGIRMVYNFETIIAVGILGHHPSAWPPVLPNYVLASTSLHAFWSRNWHQFLRRTFLVTGGYPLQSIFGTPGLIFGTFLSSGLMHSWGLYAIGRGTDWDSAIFFVFQPVALLAEKTWHKTTGQRVRGISGWVWTACWILGVGQLLSESMCPLKCTDFRVLIVFLSTSIRRFAANAWHRRGFAGGILIPPMISPTRNFLFPRLFPILEKHIIW